MDQHDSPSRLLRGRVWALEDVRAYAVTKCETTFIRTVAEAADLQHSTMHNFLKGAMPHPRVRRKLAAWYEREIGGAGEAVRDALLVILAGLPVEKQSDALAGLRDAVAGLYRSAGFRPPMWAAE